MSNPAVQALDELFRRMGSPRITQRAPYSERLAWEGAIMRLRKELEKSEEDHASWCITNKSCNCAPMENK